MSRDTETVSDSLLITYHKTAVALNGALHSHLPIISDLSIDLGEDRLLTVTGHNEKSATLTVEELRESPEGGVVLARFIFRQGRPVDIIDETGQYISPRDIGSAVLETHIQVATVVREHLQPSYSLSPETI